MILTKKINGGIQARANHKAIFKTDTGISTVCLLEIQVLAVTAGETDTRDTDRSYGQRFR